jgi:hypothetical protein
MKRLAKVLAAAGLALALVGAAHARQDDIDVNRLRGSLDQLSNDPSLGHYALSEQARAREAIRTLEAAGRSGRPHALYLAEESGADAELARVKARLGAARAEMQNKLQENTRLRNEGEQLAARQQQMEQAAPAPAADSSAPLPVGDMPAPSASVLSAPVDGAPIPPADNPAPATSSGIPGGQP